ncbi:hypothetical protein EVJ32_13920 [Exiguobacterium sp. SH5S4]|uniref:hypothetical protein n=1 Tax=Exiguobacterium sp. SH5S4 TaxID=2510961 RepID=UPI001039546D|nr:hypothetical protein [Exiguobacterium sp. SH5S4]TCI24531.1 hypothetical protein EVJ32_13920 [Exiguobacterium sp. SH5S4]
MVSQQRLKRPVSALVAIVFLTSLLTTTFFEIYSTVSASTPIKPVILELTDLAEKDKNTTNVTYIIPSQLNLGTKYTVETMTVKQFNASREDLLGKYDAVVFGPSRAAGTQAKYSASTVKYDPSLTGDDAIKNVTRLSHDTREHNNDITALKVQQIQNELLANGVPVFLHEDVFVKQNNLPKKIDQLKQSNAIVFKTVDEVSSYLKTYFATNKPNKINQVTTKQGTKTLTSLVDIESETSIIPAERGKEIRFNYSLENTPSADATVELYIDFDSNDRFTQNEWIQTVEAKQTGSISYTIDAPSYTSPRYWKIVMKDSIAKTYSYKTGRFLLKDEKATAKVLQVTADVSGDPVTGKLSDTFSNNQMLSYGDYYDFNLEIITYKQLVDKICEQNLNKNKEWFYSKDLIIFGFKDSYISELTDTCTHTELTKFMDQGRGVMFTHDMLYRTANSGKFNVKNMWESNFASRFATREYTNMGIYAQNPSTEIVQTATGLFTEYPYKISSNSISKKKVKTTHNQYFSLDLENEDLTTWFNLVGSNRTAGDSSNHYYMYTVGNLTYSGAGHVQTFDEQDEKEIFVNTMFRAFIGSNHAPKIEVINPQLEQNRQASVYDIEPLYLSWKSLDYDFADRFLDTRVLVNEKQVYPAENGKFASVRNGETSGFFYEHNAQAGSQLNVRIETKEQRTKGAITSTESFVVNVLKSEEAAFVSRTISPLTTEVENQIALTYNLNYSVPFIQKPNGNAYKEFAWTVNVEETIPSGYTVLDSSLPTGWKRVGDKLVGSISDECVIEKNDSSCKVNDTKVEVKLVANKVGNYTFDRGTFDYVFEANHNSNGTNKHDVEKEGAGKLTSVNTTVLEKEIERLQLEGPIYLNIGETRQVTPILTPETARKLDLKWVIGSSAAELTPSYVNNSASIKGMKPGKTTVRVEYTSPVTGKTIQSNEIEIIVDDPPTQFSANNLNLLVGEEGIIRPSIKTTNDEYRNFRFDIVSGQNAVEVVQQTKQELKLSGNAPGTVQVKVSLVNQPANQPVAPIFVNVKVSLPALSVSPTEATLWVYRDSEGTLVQQSTSLSLIQTGSVRLPVSWELPSGTSEITLGTPRVDGVTVKAVQGTGTTQRLIPVTGAFTNFASQRVTAMIDVKEYPQDMLASNIELYMENSPYTYEPVFLPSTANVRGFGMQVAEGSDVVEIVDQTKLRLKKPGLAKVRIATEDVSRFFSGTNGPKIVYREFYVRVREGTDPNPGSPEDAGDYY